MHQIYKEESIWGFINSYVVVVLFEFFLMFIFVLNPGLIYFLLFTFFIQCLN